MLFSDQHQVPTAMSGAWLILSVVALVMPATGSAQVGRAQSGALARDTCDFDDNARMSFSKGSTQQGPSIANYAGSWSLLLSKSRDLPPLWRNAKDATLLVTQNAQQLTAGLTVVTATDTIAYSVLAFNLDGSDRTFQNKGKGTTLTAASLRNGGNILQLWSADQGVALGTELITVKRESWQLASGGRELSVCRTLQDKLTRKDSRLVFIRQ